MDTTKSITQLLNLVREGRDEDAAAKLCHAYYEHLKRVASRHLADLPKRVFDEDDVAQSAMNSFFRAAENGRLKYLRNRNDLWRLLVTITARKVNRVREHIMAQKRGAGHVDGESGFFRGTARDPANLTSIVDDDEVDAFLAECDDLIAQLPNELLQQIATKHLAGLTIREIADSQDISLSAVNRKLARIRGRWKVLLEE